MVKRATHEPLIDRKTWELAQRKRAAEKERTSFAPRNPAYYLKQLFVCGHCGKNLTGRTEIDRAGKRTVVYVCPTYIAGKCGGFDVKCGYQRISHDDAEQMLLDKIAELGLEYDQTASQDARANLQDRLARLGHDGEDFVKKWQTWVDEGIGALIEYLQRTYEPEWPAFRRLQKLAFRALWDEGLDKKDFNRLPLTLAEFKKAIQEAEKIAVEQAKKKLTELREEHKAYTKNWVRASDEMQSVLKQEIERLETQIHEWEPRTVPLTKRLERLLVAEKARQAEREKLVAEWPAMENREKGEAMRRLFKTVTLFWGKKFHPASKKPTRPRKTNRLGRYSYPLQKERIQWVFASSDLESSS